MAGLWLALFRVRFPSLGRMRLYDGLWAGAAAVLLFGSPAGSFALLVQWIPRRRLEPLWAQVSWPGSPCWHGDMFSPPGRCAPGCGSPPWGHWPPAPCGEWRGFCGTAASGPPRAGCYWPPRYFSRALAVAGALLERVDHFALPRFARLAPVTLVSSGLVLLAFQALRQML